MISLHRRMAVILQITAERGTLLVAAGDVVKKGDVLISSALTIGLEGEEAAYRIYCGGRHRNGAHLAAAD